MIQLTQTLTPDESFQAWPWVQEDLEASTSRILVTAQPQGAAFVSERASKSQRGQRVPA